MNDRRLIWAMLAAATMLSVGMGFRQSLGLFLVPMSQGLGLGLSVLSLSMAIQQILWGLCQPVAGALADRHGAAPVVAGGLLLYGAGLFLVPMADQAWLAHATLGVMLGMGVSACGFSVVFSAVSKIVPDAQRSLALGLVSAGGSLGQVAAPALAQAAIQAWTWTTTMEFAALALIAAAPLALLLKGPRSGSAGDGVASAASLSEALTRAFADPSYRLLTLGFMVCGFHVAFVATHLPGVIASCGLSPDVSASALAILGLGNVIGSYAIGHMGQFIRLKWLLSGLYAARTLTILIFLAVPKTSLTFLILSGILGLTWLATVAPTNGLVTKLHGTRYVTTLFGLVFLSHQVGAFLGTIAGGWSYDHFGTYDPVWYVAAGLAALSALAHLPIREAKIMASSPA